MTPWTLSRQQKPTDSRYAPQPKLNRGTLSFSETMFPSRLLVLKLQRCNGSHNSVSLLYNLVLRSRHRSCTAPPSLPCAGHGMKPRPPNHRRPCPSLPPKTLETPQPGKTARSAQNGCLIMIIMYTALRIPSRNSTPSPRSLRKLAVSRQGSTWNKTGIVTELT